MALSQQQQEQTLGQGYTHKKFNCGYLHKKLGRRFRQREPANMEIISQPQAEQKMKIAKHSKDIFRPYALDDRRTERIQKVSRSTEEAVSKENSDATKKTAHTSPIEANGQNHRQQQNNPLHSVTAISCPTTITASSGAYYAAALNPNSYNMRLESERAALYMRYMAQLQSEKFAASLQTAFNYSMGYPLVTAPIFNGC